MAVNLNLLPQEYSVKSGLGAYARLARTLTIILSTFFSVFVLGAIAFFLVSSYTLRQTTAEIEILKSQIKSRQDTELRLALLKDRLAKVKIALSQGSTYRTIEKIEPLLNNLSDASVGELNIDSQKIEASVAFSSFLGLSNFFQNLYSMDSFKSIVMTSFGYNPITGYLTNIRFK